MGRGWIYDPESRAKYDVEIAPDGQQKLKVLGYAGSMMFGQTMTWTKAPADLKRCEYFLPGVVTAQASPQESVPVATASQTFAAATSTTDGAPAAAVPVADDRRPEVVAKGARLASGTEDAVADANSQRTGRRAAMAKKRAKPEQLIRLSELGSGSVTLRKSRGACKLTIGEIGRVSFPC